VQQKHFECELIKKIFILQFITEFPHQWNHYIRNDEEHEEIKKIYSKLKILQNVLFYFEEKKMKKL
jgi:hypothetical protein